jgi:bile acid:Na+ symporter, BASS family
MRGRDILLIVVAFAGVAAGVFTPDLSLVFTPATLYMMMAILYMSFLRIDFASLTRLGPAELGQVLLWSGLKLILLPLILWGLARWLAPDWALAVLLLAGVSAGVTAPFFAQVLGVNPARTLQVTVLSSILVPLTLPGLVKLLMGAEMDIPFSTMFRLLALVIFVPLVSAYLTKKFWPAMLGYMDRVQLPLTLAMFFAINAGVFAPYSGFLRSRLDDVALAIALASLVAAAYLLIMWLVMALSRDKAQSMAGGVGLIFVNNVLVVVFAARFFGPECPLLSAVYMLPLFMSLVPLRILASRILSKETP